jgi:release factor glutamine methyltransferase
MDQDRFRTGVHLAAVHQRVTDQPIEFSLLGLVWELLPGVYAPTRGAATRLFSQWLPYPVGGSFLEIGCGAGVTAVTAALRGCARVTASDINTSAVRNVAVNAVRHGVRDRVTPLYSDLFDGLDPADRYDLIFWNSNVVEAPHGYAPREILERAILDPGYRTHRRYLAQGPGRLTGSGRLFLGFNSLGNRPELERIAARSQLRVVQRQCETQVIGGELNLDVELQLLELIPASGPAR